MRRILGLLALLALLAAWSVLTQRHEIGALALTGDADAVGAVVSVNGRALGRMRAEWRGSAPGSDPTRAEQRAAGAAVSPPARRDRVLGARFDARVPLQRSNEIVVASPRGVRLAVWTPLGESTLVQVSFRERHLTVQPAGARALHAEADTSAEYDD